MNQNVFGALFILAMTMILIAFNYFYGLDNLTPFIMVPILASYFLGRYSTTFPKEKD